MTAKPSTIQSLLYRERGVLVLFGEFTALKEDLDLHCLSLGIDYDPFVRELLIDGLSALSLHLASRSVDEHVGWTINLQRPAPMNLFFTGSRSDHSVVGRAFLEAEEGVTRQGNLFVCQSTREHGERRESFVEVEGVDIFGMVERYYDQSEQKLARFFHRARADRDGEAEMPRRDAEIVFLQLLPDGDASWLRAATTEEVFALLGAGDLEALATESLRFRCGCDRERMAKCLVAVYQNQPEALFGADDSVEVECPRCGARLAVTREDYQRTLDG